MPRSLPASVSVLRTGLEFTADVLNLTPCSLFVANDVQLRFRDGVTIRFSGLQVEGLVVFASERPRGAVVLFRARPQDRHLIRSLAAGFASGNASPSPDSGPVRPGGERSVSTAPSMTPDPRPGRQLGAGDDVTEPPKRGGAVVIEPLHLDDSTLTTEEDPTTRPPSSSTGRVGLEKLVRDIMDGPVSKAPTSNSSDPALESEREITLLDPSALLAEPSSSGAGFERPSFEGIECDDKTNEDTTARGAPGDPPAFPVLDSDGTTVRFESLAQYRAQFQATIMHGSIVAISRPLPIGTPRSLAIAVPGCNRYIVSARVLFNEGDRTGFRIEAFNNHRSYLTALTLPQ